MKSLNAVFKSVEGAEDSLADGAKIIIDKAINNNDVVINNDAIIDNEIIDYLENEVPYYTQGWEDKFLQSNSIEKSIFFIQKLTNRNEKFKKSKSYYQ